MKYLERKTGTGKHHLVRDDGSLFCNMVLGHRYREVPRVSTPCCHMCHNNYLKQYFPDRKRQRKKDDDLQLWRYV